jgi:type II secretory pathway pseudopilin PulG
MRKVRLLAAGLPLVVVAITALVVVPNWGGETPDANLAAAQPNLQTALQAAETYYAAHGNSFLGLMNPETPTTLSSIQQIDNYRRSVHGSARHQHVRR